MMKVSRSIPSLSAAALTREALVLKRALIMDIYLNSSGFLVGIYVFVNLK
jgi:hypothetical protein